MNYEKLNLRVDKEKLENLAKYSQNKKIVIWTTMSCVFTLLVVFFSALLLLIYRSNTNAKIYYIVCGSIIGFFFLLWLFVLGPVSVMVSVSFWIKNLLNREDGKIWKNYKPNYVSIRFDVWVAIKCFNTYHKKANSFNKEEQQILSDFLSAYDNKDKVFQSDEPF